MLTIQKIFLAQLVILFAFTSCSETTKIDINLDNFLSPKSNQVFKYKISMQSSNEYHDITYMDDRYIEKVGNNIKNHCINISNYSLFNKDDLNTMPQNMQEILKRQNFRVENISEEFCSKNDTLIFNEIIIYKNIDYWKNELQIEEFGTNDNLQKILITTSECSTVDITEKRLFDKTRKVIHSQCNWNNNGSEDKFEYFIAEGLGVYRFMHTSSHKETESKSIMTVALDTVSIIK